MRASGVLQERLRTSWIVLGAGFILLSIDEAADVRMILKNVVFAFASEEAKSNLTTVLPVLWTVPVLAIVGLLFVFFIPFIRSLGHNEALHFLTAGGAFVFAATGIENIQGDHMIQTGGVRDFWFMILVTIEESTEIAAILYFQNRLIRMIRRLHTN